MRFIILLIAALFLSPAYTFAEPLDIDKLLGLEKKEEKKPTIKDFSSTFEFYSKWVEELTDPKHYDKLSFTNEKDKTTIKFSDLSDKDKDFFYLVQYENLTFNIAQLYFNWDMEVVKAPENSEGDNRIANQDDVHEYQDKLFKLRQKLASNYEEYIVTCLAKYPEVVSKKEADNYLGKIKKFHEGEKLIERK